MKNFYVNKTEIEVLCITFEISHTMNLYNKKLEDVQEEIASELKRRDQSAYELWQDAPIEDRKTPSKFFIKKEES